MFNLLAENCTSESSQIIPNLDYNQSKKYIYDPNLDYNQSEKYIYNVNFDHYQSEKYIYNVNLDYNQSEKCKKLKSVIWFDLKRLVYDCPVCRWI